MLKINIFLRFALIVVCLLGGIGLWIAFDFWYAFIFLLTGIVLLVGYVFMGTVMSASELAQTSDFEAAEARLNLTYFPNLLYKTNRAFYYLLKGSFEMQKKNIKQAEVYLKTAKEIELPSDNEKAMVELQLAGIQAQRNNWAAVKKHVSFVKKLDVTEPQIKTQILQFEQGIKQKGNVQLARQMNQGAVPANSRSKRRRPKMR